MFTAEKIQEMARHVLDFFETEELREQRSHREIVRCLMDSDPEVIMMADRKERIFKVVGRKFARDGIIVEIYDDALGGIVVKCEDDSLGEGVFGDGEVFVADGEGKTIIFEHGEWENILEELYEECLYS